MVWEMSQFFKIIKCKKKKMLSRGELCGLHVQNVASSGKYSIPTILLSPSIVGIPCWPSGYDSAPPLLGAWVPFLVKELIFLRAWGTARNKKTPHCVSKGISK